MLIYLVISCRQECYDKRIKKLIRRRIHQKRRKKDYYKLFSTSFNILLKSIITILVSSLVIISHSLVREDIVVPNTSFSVNSSIIVRFPFHLF